MGESNYDEIFMRCSLRFAESLKDLKNLREHLYSAAEYFESSYHKSHHQQLVIESSKDYVTKAIVSSVDHLGSVADKLNKLLDKKANEFSATNIRLSCLQQRLRTLQGLRGECCFFTVETPNHNKRYNSQGAAAVCFEKGKLINTNCRPCSQYEMRQSNQDNPSFQVQPQPPLSTYLTNLFASTINVTTLTRDLQSRHGSSPNTLTRVMSKKDTGKQLLSPHGFLGSLAIANTSFYPTSSHNKHPSPRAIISNTTKKEREISESHTKRGKHLFKALFNATKGNHKLQLVQR